MDEICTKSELAWPLTPFSATDATLNSNNGSFISPVKTQNNVRSVSNHTLSLPSSTHFQSDQSNPRDTLPLAWNEQVLSFFEQRFEGFLEIAVPAFAVSYIFFFGIGGFLHVSYTTRLQWNIVKHINDIHNAKVKISNPP